MMAETARTYSESNDSSYRYFSADEIPTFRKNFNQHSFVFTHKLAGHPLFEMPRLIRLANTVRKLPEARYDEVYFDT